MDNNVSRQPVRFTTKGDGLFVMESSYPKLNLTISLSIDFRPMQAQCRQLINAAEKLKVCNG